MTAADERRLTPTSRVHSGLSATFFLLVLSACSRHGPAQAYDQALSAYIAGDLARAVSESSENAEHLQGDRFWHWKFRLLEAEALTVQSRNRDAEKLLLDPVPASDRLTQLEVRRLIDLANLPSHRAESAQLLDRAQKAVSDPDLAIRIQLSRGSLAMIASDLPAAHTAFSNALEIARGHSLDYYQAAALTSLSYCDKQQKRYEDSIEAGLQGLAIANRAKAQRIAASARGNVGATYAYLGDFESALALQKEAVRMFESMGARSGLATALGELGLLYDMQDDTARAIPTYERAYQVACDLKDDRGAARFAENLSTALIKSERWEAAAEWNRRASDLAAAVKAEESLPYLERNRARIADALGHPDEAAGICEDLIRAHNADRGILWAAYNLLGTIRARQKRFTDADRAFQSGLEIIDGTRAELLNGHYRITLLSRLIPFYQQYADVLVEQNDDARALRVIESSRARVLAERLGRDFSPQRFTDRTALERFARSTNTALLSFWLAPQRSYAWLITAEGTRRFPLPPATTIEKLVTGYRALVEHSVQDPLTAHNSAIPALWNTLMADVAPHIPKGSRVVVIPDGPLHRLNLETLVRPEPQPHYWIEDVELAVAPSLAIAMSQPVKDGRPAQSALLIGAPDYRGTSYEPLRGAEREIRDIQARLSGSSPAVYLGPQATPAAYREAGPERFSIIHFAAHAEANAEKPLESAVMLTRKNESYKLYARDVVEIPIRADLVTLSACHSAGSRAYAGEGLMGFAWAFLHAGARAVVAGLWDASDEATAALMDRFYAGIAEGQAPAAALHAAKLAFVKGDVRYRKPFFWGPFQTYVSSVAP
jgi:CHAT domain-containing protein